MRFALPALFVLWFLPAAAQTNTTPGTPAPASVSEAGDQKLICVDQDPGTASRLQPKRVCHTRQEWKKLGGIPK